MQSKLTSIGLMAVLLLIVTACVKQPNYDEQGTDTRDTPAPNMSMDIGDFIDQQAGHPSDPTLPRRVSGVTDEELVAADESVYERLFSEGIDFANRNMNEPRYLFAIGRAGYVYGHDSTEAWLSRAADAGSAGAKVDYGYALFYDGAGEEAATLIQEGMSLNFNEEGLGEFVDHIRESIFRPEAYNRPGLIEALYTGKGISRTLVNTLYIGTIQNTLWSSEIIFLTETPDIFLELDAELSAREGVKAQNSKVEIYKENIQLISQFLEGLPFEGLVRRAAGRLSSVLGGEIREEDLSIIEEGTQDGRRLAVLYLNNPGAFRKIYDGMIAYSQKK